MLKFSNLINYDFVSDLKFHNPNDEDRNRRVKKDAKQCALIAIDEIIKEHYPQDAKRCEYWNQVKTEIQKL